MPSTDVIVMGHILHDWDLDEKRYLIAKAPTRSAMEGLAPDPPLSLPPIDSGSCGRVISGVWRLPE